MLYCSCVYVFVVENDYVLKFQNRRNKFEILPNFAGSCLKWHRACFEEYIWINGFDENSLRKDLYFHLINEKTLLNFKFYRNKKF